MANTEHQAAVLDEATRVATATTQLSSASALSLEDAYEIQRAGISLRKTRGDAVVGVKLGFTSKAKAMQMGVSDVIIGVLTEQMQVADRGVVDRSRFIHPRIEPEVAFRLGADVDPSDPSDDPLTAATQVAPAMEIIDSRYQDFKFSLEDVVADNTSAAAFVIGPWQPMRTVQGRLDLGDLDVALDVGDVLVETGSTADILGDPLRALPTVKRMARQYGLQLPAGTIILAGAATAAVPLPSEPGVTVSATVAGLGRVSVTIATGPLHG